MDMVSASFACKRTKILQDSERQLMKSSDIIILRFVGSMGDIEILQQPSDWRTPCMPKYDCIRMRTVRATLVCGLPLGACAASRRT